MLQDKHYILGKQFIHPGEIVEAHNFKHSLLKNVLIKHNYLLFSTFPSFLQDKATHFYTNGSPYKKVLQVGVGNLDKKYYYYLFNHNLKRHIFFLHFKMLCILKKAINISICTTRKQYYIYIIVNVCNYAFFNARQLIIWNSTVGC